MLPLGGAVETPKNHEVILVFPRVPDRDIPEHMTISSQKANHQGPYLPPLMAHTTCPPLPRPGFAVREEVAAPISYPRLMPYGATRSVLKSLAATSTTPWGIWPMAAMMHSMVTAS